MHKHLFKGHIGLMPLATVAWQSGDSALIATMTERPGSHQCCLRCGITAAWKLKGHKTPCATCKMK
jgi:hypothetical protein